MQSQATTFDGLDDAFHNTIDIMINPRFQVHLEHNDMLSAGTLTELKSAMENPRKELEGLERDIRALELTLSALCTQQDGLKGALATYQPLLSPIRGLTDDALEEIFQHCLPVSRNPRPFVSEAPLLLTLVCKKWRRIALATPGLWSKLHIPLVLSYNPATMNAFREFHPVLGSLLSLSSASIDELQAARNIALENWLSRSGSLPLSISLYSSDPPYYSGMTDELVRFASQQRKTLDLIAKYAYRLSYLELVVSHEVLEEFDSTIRAQNGPGTPLPSLRRFRIRSSQSSSTLRGLPSAIKTPHPITFISGSPSLREVSIQAFYGLSYQDISSLPSNLTAVSLHGHTDATIVQYILQKCSRLQRFSANILHSSTSLHSASADLPILTDIHLPDLKVFSIFGSFSDIQLLCGPLETPNLHHLQLHVVNWHMNPDGHYMIPGPPPEAPEREIDLSYPPSSTESLCVFLSQCTRLRSLTIDPTTSLASEIQSIFSAVPQVENLVLNNSFASARPSSQITTEQSGPMGFVTLGLLKYHLHPLLAQERVSKLTGDRTFIDEPLLPNLKSFTWNQFSVEIPKELFAQFIMARLHGPDRLSPPEAHPTQSLRDINVQLFLKSDATAFENEINRHADLHGLKQGVDYNLRASYYPWVERRYAPIPRYHAPRRASEPFTNLTSDDNLHYAEDVTWHLIDILD